MSLDETEAYSRYLSWALSQARAEVSEEFPSLESFRYGLVTKYRTVMRPLAHDQRRELACALTKYRFQKQFRKFALMSPNLISPAELELAEEYHIRANSGYPEEIERELESASRPELFRIPPKLIKRCVQDKWMSEFPDAEGEESGTAWRTSVRRSGMVIETYFDVGSRLANLSYRQNLLIGGDVLLQSVSAQAWLGISGQTDWSHVREDELPQVADAVVSLSKRFIEIAPELRG